MKSQWSSVSWLLLMVAIILPTEAKPAETAISANRFIYEPNDTMVLSYKDVPETSHVMVGIGYPGAPDTATNHGNWLRGASDGKVSVTGISAYGRYEARVYDSASQTVLARTVFMVGGANCLDQTVGKQRDCQPKLELPARVAVGEAISANFEGGGAARVPDRVVLVPEGTRDGRWGRDPFILKEVFAGTHEFFVDTPGRYEVRYHVGGAAEPVTRASVEVVAVTNESQRIDSDGVKNSDEIGEGIASVSDPASVSTEPVSTEGHTNNGLVPEELKKAIQVGLEGRVTQPGYGTYGVRISQRGSLFFIEYPGLCTGILDFVERQGASFVFQETIQTGFSRCTAGGFVTLSARDDGRVSFLWAEVRNGSAVAESLFDMEPYHKEAIASLHDRLIHIEERLVSADNDTNDGVSRTTPKQETNDQEKKTEDLDGRSEVIGKWEAARNTEERCAVLLQWATDWKEAYDPPAFLGGRFDVATHQIWGKAFTDPEFIPVFGVPIEEFEDTDEILHEVLPYCRNFGDAFGEAMKDSRQRVVAGFNRRPSQRPGMDIISAIEAAKEHRKVAAQIDSAIEQIESLELKAGSYSQLASTRNMVGRFWGWATASDIQRLNAVLLPKLQQSALVSLTQDVEREINRKPSASTARSLARFEERYKPQLADLSPSDAQEILSVIAEQLDYVLKEEFEAYADQLSVLNADAEGARNLGKIYRQAFSKYEDFWTSGAAFKFRQRLAKKEDEISPSAASELVQEVQELETLEDVRAFRSAALGREDVWDRPELKPVLISLLERHVKIWEYIEVSDMQVWPLPRVSPAGELRRLKENDDLPIMAHEILIAILEELEGAGSTRVGPNTVVFRLMSLNTALLISEAPIVGFPITDLRAPLEQEIDLYRVRDVSCTPSSSHVEGRKAYSCRYKLDGSLHGAQSGGLFQSEFTENFELSGYSNWLVPSLERRIAEVSLLAWGELANTVNKGLHAGGCVGAALGGIVNFRCY